MWVSGDEGFSIRCETYNVVQPFPLSYEKKNLLIELKKFNYFFLKNVFQHTFNKNKNKNR